MYLRQYQRHLLCSFGNFRASKVRTLNINKLFTHDKSCNYLWIVSSDEASAALCVVHTFLSCLTHGGQSSMNRGSLSKWFRKASMVVRAEKPRDLNLESDHNFHTSRS